MKTTFLPTATRHLLRASLLTALLGASLPTLAQSGDKDQLVVPLSSPGKPGMLRVKLVNGSINVVGYSGKDVIIDAGSREGKRTATRPIPANANGLRRIDNDSGVELTVDENDNRINVKTDSYRHPVNLVIKVPQHFSLQISTVQDGNIVVENVTGELEVGNVNGGIQLKDVSGSAVANTVNGPVTATFRSVTTSTPMAFSSVNGAIDVTFPSNTKAALKLKSDQGEIYSDFDLVTEKSAAKINRTNEGGTYRVNVDNWTYGKLNGGGSEVMMKTLNGNIYIRKAK
ncbi:DUF4097 family beta strand repeat-containing protein [Hymenobacter sp. GOD-10R]|uniref:DUF4097 family beta strand repeat-containing protein n=1 Tax=Hymenobacter sp. GOD-10R TaxID=3093922 RepID=UPI002D795480|nr:DUF4097 family beta strand repeat-containing protein [Hymenobacter sp. GOD-10R]WRQ30761.1 DUF4097 family beta strand repeat-containing protein [Hymenobacter sp. GOD-10R]